MTDTALASTSPGALAPAAERGRTTIADKVVQRVASIAAGEVESVLETRTGWTSLLGRGLPRAEATMSGRTSTIRVEVAASWPTPLATLTQQVREHVSTRVRDLTGVEATRVDVVVADVVTQGPEPRRVR